MLTLPRPHYAWLVCLGGTLAMVSTLGLGLNMLSVYLPEILQKGSFTNTQGSWITTVRSVFTVGTMFFVNQLCARFSLRRIITLGVSLVSCSFFVFAAADRFILFCCATALMGTGYCLAGIVPLSLVAGRWFHSRRGLAMGLISAGSGIATILAPTIITRSKAAFGLNHTFVLQGCVILLFAALVRLLIRDDPADLGLSAYDDRTDSSGGAQTARLEVQHPAAWKNFAILFSAVLIGGPIGPTFSYLSALYRTEGYDEMVVAGLVSFLGVTLILGKIVCGQVYDRVGGFRGNFFAGSLLLGGLILLCLSPTGSIPVAVAALTAYGLGLAVTTVTPARWAGDLYGEAGYDRAVRSITLANSIGSLVFSPIPGMLADHFGSYVPAYVMFAALMLAALIIIQPIYAARR